MRPHSCVAAAMLFAECLPLTAHAADPTTGPLAQSASQAMPFESPQPTEPGRASASAVGEGVSLRPDDAASGDQTTKFMSLPTSAPPLTGLFPEFGKTLLDAGIDIHGVAADHFLANPTAGAVTGQTANLGAFRPAVDLDLEKLIGLPGGNMHVAMTFFGFRSDLPQIITQTGGVIDGFQTTPAMETDLVSVFTYEQRLLDSRLSIEFGRTNVYNYFLLPNSLDPFSYYSTAFEADGDFPSVPYPVWGSRASYKLGSSWFVQGGAFEDNFRSATSYGDRLGANLSSGAQLLAELGQRSDFSDEPYPSNLEAGLEWNTRTGRSNLKGTGAPATRFLEPTNYPGGGVIFLQGEQVVWRGAQRDVGPPRNIAVYGSFDASVDKPQPIDLDTMTGVNFTGFVPGRPFDVLELQSRYQRLSQIEANDETLRHLLLIGPGPSQRRDGFSFEAIANLQLTPSVAFRPLIQYFVNPDNYYPPAAYGGRPKDGVEVGFFAVVSLGRLLGTSMKPF